MYTRLFYLFTFPGLILCFDMFKKKKKKPQNYHLILRPMPDRLIISETFIVDRQYRISTLRAYST